MEHKIEEIKEGIKFHTINTNKFKTNLFAIFLTTKLNRENVTKNALISMLLRRGSKTMKTQEEISKKMEELYGAGFDCGLDKTGNNQVLKFYIEAINDKYLPEHGENILKIVLESLLDIVFNPYTEDNGFKKEYVEQEKNSVKKRIEGKKDNKARYALERCIEEMYKNQPYGIYKFGYEEDLNKINEKDLYKYYNELINTCKIDLFLSGNILEEEVKEIISENENIKKLKEREPFFELQKFPEENHQKEEQTITETMDVIQGKLVIGLNVNIENEEEKYTTLMYNSILGGSANSKLFQNVREKAHLAYVASSTYYRFKSIIFINSGIEISDYDKALKVIREQIEEMKQGNFTEEDIENSKKGIIAAIKTIDDEQDTGITYYFGQELAESNVSEEEYIKKIENIGKEDIVDIANKVQINTIYFLKD